MISAERNEKINEMEKDNKYLHEYSYYLSQQEFKKLNNI